MESRPSTAVTGATHTMTLLIAVFAALMFLAAPVSAQTIQFYTIGIFAPGSSPPAAPPIATIQLPGAVVTCNQVPIAPITAPIILDTVTAARFAFTDPVVAGRECITLDQSGNLKLLASSNAVPACTTAPCPLYPWFAQATDDIGRTGAWSVVGVPPFTRVAPVVPVPVLLNPHVGR